LSTRTANSSSRIRDKGTFHLALSSCGGDPERLARAFVSCPRVTRILNVLSDRCGFDHVALDPTLQSEVWMRLWPRLPWTDVPENIYSYIWRIAEFTAMGMVRQVHRIDNQETDLEHVADDDGAIAEDEMDQPRQGHQGQRTYDGGLGHMESEIDTDQMRSKFAAKLARVGWPDGIDPAQCEVMRRPGQKFRHEQEPEPDGEGKR